MDSPIAILGAGSWGTALALLLARRGQHVRLWSHDTERVNTMEKDRANNRYLPGHTFPESLLITSQLSTAVADNCDILVAVPSAGFHDVLLALRTEISDSTRVVWATKGLDLASGQLLHQVANRTLGTTRPYAIISGPTFANEVAKGLPTAVVVASQHADFAHDLITRFSCPHFRVYRSTDMTGVEIGGVVKNVLAIATGISDGMQLGANARSALITRGLAEMIRLGLCAGGQYETFTGLAGLGDLVLTCTDNQSRNKRFGLALGSGKTVQETEREIGQVIEGKRNAELVVQLAKTLHIEMPITETVWQFLQGRITLPEAMNNLLSRTPKAE